MPQDRAICAMVLLVGLSCSIAVADTITLRGTSIPMRGVTIEAIQDGVVHYRDQRGRRMTRELAQVAVLGFENAPSLDEAEKASQEGDLGGALTHLLDARLEAQREVESLWIHARLSKTHDARKEFVQAAGHLGVVLAIREDPYWRNLKPISPPDQPSYAAAHEALGALDQARRRVQASGLRQFVDELYRTVRAIHDPLARRYDGPEIEPGSTLSGFPIEAIRDGQINLTPTVQAIPEPDPLPDVTSDPTPPVRETSSGDDAIPVTGRADEPPGDEAGPNSPASIEALLRAGRSGEALAICRLLEAEPGDRPLDGFLHQFGRALQSEGEPRDAAVMFLRCALLFPGSTFAPTSLIEVAAIYRTEFDNRAVAGRLLRRAAEAADSIGRVDDARRARERIRALDDTKTDTGG